MRAAANATLEPIDEYACDECAINYKTMHGINEPPFQIFIDWILSHEGQRAIATTYSAGEQVCYSTTQTFVLQNHA